MRNTIVSCLLFLVPMGLIAQPAHADLDKNQEQGLHLDWINKNVKPTDDFFSYSNGQWQTMNPIPSSFSRWGVFNLVQNRNNEIIKSVLESPIDKNTEPMGSDMQKAKDFYFSGMDEATINKVGFQPLNDEFKQIDTIKDKAELQRVIAHLQMIGVDALFGFSQMQDFKNSQQVIGAAFQGGLGLPDRDYYLKTDEEFVKIRQAYLKHLTAMFILLGDDAKNASTQADTVLAIETILAKASMSLIDQRDPNAVYHMKTSEELQQITPNFSWPHYFADIGHPEIKQINLATPDFFKVMDTQLAQLPLTQWKTYLRWHLIDSFAPYLSTEFVNEDFKMMSLLGGAKELKPRWMRVIGTEDGALGFAVGKLYVQKEFPPQAKKEAVEILANIRQTFRKELQQVTWMAPSTRKAAINKLDKMEFRVGYPEQWRDYSALSIDRGPYVLNVLRSAVFLSQRELNKIGKPVDKNEWEMTPQTVNAYYDPSNNSLNIPAGILQPPFFEVAAPPAVNYGAMGFVMGHEMTHGFDDEGARFDAEGNLKNWWDAEDFKRFKLATQCISDQYSQYTVNGNLHVQGPLVTGEATADLGGLILAYHAFQASKDFKQAKDIEGFTPTQQFFLGASHLWAMNSRPEALSISIITDPHPPEMFRVNGTLANMTEFAEAFNAAKNSPMVSAQRCVIW